jgi:hypothetical protein
MQSSPSTTDAIAAGLGRGVSAERLTTLRALLDRSVADGWRRERRESLRIIAQCA